MIVKQHNAGWEIVSQYTHGLLAGKIASFLHEKLKDSIWIDLLTAIIEHDDNLPDFEKGQHITRAGAPMDFTLKEDNLENSYEHATDIYATSIQKSQFIGLMVGRHLEFLFAEKAKSHKGFKDFFNKIDKDRKLQLDLYGISGKSLENYYDIMRFCDRCSLLICQGLIPTDGRKIEINKTINNKDYFITKTDKNTFRIEPWPFASKNFKLHYESRIVDQLKFKNDAELETALKKSLIKVNSILIVE